MISPLAVLGLVVVTLVALLYLAVWLFSHTPRKPLPSEFTYTTNIDREKQAKQHFDLPPPNAPAADSIFLTVVIPCYNETSRLKGMLDEAIAYLDKEYPKKYEILIVDDGSSDGTADYALQLATELGLPPHTMRVVKLEQNRGKGGAVCHGMQVARGSYIMFADGDGASKFSDVSKLIASIEGLDNKQPESSPALAAGSRAHMVNTDAVVKRSFIRNLLMYGLHTLVFVFGIRDVKDTQCGFKLFNKQSVRQICPLMHTERWIFDVELFILAERQGIPVAEVPISWHEVEGSKMVLARDSVSMAIDLVVTRMAYILGVYSGGGKVKKE